MAAPLPIRWASTAALRLDISQHVYFAYDQLAVRFIEELDSDHAAVDATAALITAAS